jgi:ATP-binding cassette, subfamily G (WHITE), member 2, SNQ2
MYRLSPFTYIIEGLLGQGLFRTGFSKPFYLTYVSKSAVGKQNITCRPVELVTLEPPSGQSCGSYMQSYISSAGGYLTNPDATSACEFCSSRTTDQFLGPSFNIEYSHHWRNFGFMMAFILFNVGFHYVYIVFKQTDPCILGDLHLFLHVLIPHPHW